VKIGYFLLLVSVKDTDLIVLIPIKLEITILKDDCTIDIIDSNVHYDVHMQRNILIISIRNKNESA
jgi:hypothetical protein